MYTSVFDLFKIGVGPSSSHTVGPMVAAHEFVSLLDPLEFVDSVTVRLYGSLALTGIGHATDRAVLMGLAGYLPADVPIDELSKLPERVRDTSRLELRGHHGIEFEVARDLVFDSSFQPEHPNVVEFTAFSGGGEVAHRRFASIGGGFIADLDGDASAVIDRPAYPIEITSAAQLLVLARGSSIAEVAMTNELAVRTREEVGEGIEAIAHAMFQSIERGIRATGTLPGGLRVRRRARDLALDMREHSIARSLPPTEATDWAGVYAIAVNEENAAGHRIVTAPTNGAAGIVPAVMKFMVEFCKPQVDDPVRVFLLTATAIGSLLKANAGISGAELGCQGEVGSACSMAAAGLTAALGGSPEQVENAAEIALEHNLGLTCDPVGGLVQVPCIERNAVGAVKAITAASLALRGTGEHLVSLDAAIATLRQTGLDMDHRYKETSLGGLAVNVPDC
ncbi:MAG: L-serine ammonia-lyase [Acidimicrobiia bacterium]|nr:L-serine ammonia-lyase [Acidimicrobiia bacterium]